MPDSKSKEKITVRLYGKTVDIPRGDMTDDEWGEFKAKHENMADNVRASFLSGEKTPIEDQNKGRASALGEDGWVHGADVEASNPKIRPLGTRTVAPDAENKKREIKARGPGGEKLDENFDTSAQGVRRMVGELVKGGFDERPSSVGKVVDMSGAARTVSSEQAKGVDTNTLLVGDKPDNGTPLMDATKRIVAPVPAFTVPGGQSAAGPMPGVDINVPPSIPTMAGRAIGEVAAPISSAVQGLAQKWGSTPEGRQFMGPGQPEQPVMPPQRPGMPPPTSVGSAPNPGSTSQTSSASLKMSGPGGGALPPEKDFGLLFNDAVKMREDGIRARAEVKTLEDQSMLDMYQSQQDRDAKIQQDLMKQQETADQREAEVTSVIADARKVLSDPSQTPDPERYWQSHSKILFAIGVGLLAANGRDINGVLSSVNQAIDRDIKAQQDAFESPKKAARNAIEASKELYGMIRNKRLDAYETTQAMRSLGKDMVANQIEQIKLTNPGKINEAAANEMIGNLRQDSLQIQANIAQHSRTNAINEYRARTERMELGVKMQAAAGKANGKILSAEEGDKIGKLYAANKLVSQLGEKFNKVSGSVGGALVSKGSSMIPRTEAANYDKWRDNFLRTIGLLVDESVIQKHDADAWEANLPKSGNLNGGESFKALEHMVSVKLKEKLSALGNAGYDVSRYQPLEEEQAPLPSERPVK